MTTWQDFATVDVEISSLSGSSTPGNSGWWQPDNHAPRYWLADTVTEADSGYGVWIADTVPDNGQWNTLPWYKVHCDVMTIESSTGLEPYEWNSSSGSMTIGLWDKAIIYTPFGPVGVLDDLGIDSLIRIVVTYFSYTSAGATKPTKQWRRAIWSGFVRSIRHAISPSGTHSTTILASDIIEMYGRSNPPALPSPLPAANAVQRVRDIHNRADRPTMFPFPQMNTPFNSYYLQPDNLADNVWTELCLAANSVGTVTTVDHWKDTPQIFCRDTDVPTDTVQAPYKRMDQLRIAETCSDPKGPIVMADIIRIAPTSMSLNNDLSGLANYVDLAAVGGTAYIREDTASEGRFGKHSFTRHDLILNVPADADAIAQRVLRRLGDGTYRCDSLTFPVISTRDLIALVGQAENPSPNIEGTPLMAPGRWVTLEWTTPKVNARMFVTSVSHSITPDEWNVTISGELRSVSTALTEREREAA